MRLPIALLLTALAGCRTSASGYFDDRLRDTIDILPVSVASGPGFYVGARLTAFLGTGIGYAETSRAGSYRRPAWPEEASELVNFRQWHEHEKGLVVLWTRDADPTPGAGNIVVLPVVDEQDDFRFRFFLEPGSALDVEAEVHLFYFGFRIGVSPVQLLEWLVGWFTLDPLGDDVNARFEGRTIPVRSSDKGEKKPSKPESSP